MNKLGTTAKGQFAHMKAHRGKMIGMGVGILGGITYGMAGKKENWMVAGLAIAGAVAGGVLGGMFDKGDVVVVGTDSNGNAAVATANANDEQAMSNAIGRIGRFNRINSNARIGAAQKLYNCRVWYPDIQEWGYETGTKPCHTIKRTKNFFR